MTHVRASCSSTGADAGDQSAGSSSSAWPLSSGRGPQLVRLDLAAADDVRLGAVLEHAASAPGGGPR